MPDALIISGGPILTMDPDNPQVEAVGISGNRIVAVSDLASVRDQVAGTVEEIDLAGRTAIPGFYDAHAHPMMVGESLSQIDLSSNAVESVDDILNAIKTRTETTEPGDWIFGQGYDQANLSDNRIPTRHDLDQVSPDHPVALWRSCHHIMSVNTKALELAGVNANTPEPSDGTIDRDEHGAPTGVLRESATDAIEAAIGEPTEDEIVEHLIAGGNDFRKHGITSVAEAGIRRPEQLRAYQRLAAHGDLPLRTYLMMLIDDTLDELAALGISTGFGDDWLRIGNAKFFSDGSIGGRTARMSRPYEDESANRGLYMIPPEAITERVVRAHKAGFQIGIHAIGDAAIGSVLDAYEEAQRQMPRKDPRFRIEHCSIIDQTIIDRIAKLGAIPIPGTTFLYDMRPVYLQNLGEERVRYAYAMQTFKERGIIAAASSDAPVSSTNPMLGIKMMVSRQDRLGDEIFPEERISLDDAIAAYTKNAAYASFDETRKGMLKPGMLADVTIMETNLRDISPEDLGNVHCDMTISNGKVVYERG